MKASGKVEDREGFWLLGSLKIMKVAGKDEDREGFLEI